MSDDDPFDDELDDVSIPEPSSQSPMEASERDVDMERERGKEAGRNVCHFCGQEFRGGVPDDHFVDCDLCGETWCRNTIGEHKSAAHSRRERASKKASDVRQGAEEKGRGALREAGRQTERASRSSVGQTISGAVSSKDILMMLGAGVVLFFLFAYVRQAIMIAMVATGLIAVFADSFLSGSRLIHKTMSLIVGILWIMTSLNAILSVLAGQFVNINWASNLITAILTSIYMFTGSPPGIEEFLNDLQGISGSFFNAGGTAVHPEDGKPIYLVILGILLTGVYFVLGMTGTMGLAFSMQGVIKLFAFMAALTGPMYLYWFIHENHIGEAMRRAGRAQRMAQHRAGQGRDRMREGGRRAWNRGGQLKEKAKEHGRRKLDEMRSSEEEEEE